MATDPSQTAYTMGQAKDLLGVFGHRTVTTHAAFLVPHLRPTQKLLDVGCGPGSITCSFGALLEAGSVIGIDQSADVIEKAEQTASSHSLSNVSFQVGDATKLPFSDDTFDVVHAHAVMMHLPPNHRTTAISEMKRVAKPGGLIALRDYISDTWVVYPTELQPCLDVVPKIIAIGGGDPNAGLKTHAWARALGLDVEYHSASLECQDGEFGPALVKGMITGMAPKAVDLGLMSAGDWEEYKTMLDQLVGNEEYWCGCVCGETLCRKRIGN